jgi:hypothetical protein
MHPMARRLVVFLSSVRRGLEQERDNLPALIGGRYGQPVFDSGLSPTEEEFTRARQRGIPMLVFVKQGVEVEPRQQAFIERVQEYTGGRFRAGFTSAVDLQPQVARALAELAAQQAPLVYTPCPRLPTWPCRGSMTPPPRPERSPPTPRSWNVTRFR